MTTIQLVIAGASFVIVAIAAIIAGAWLKQRGWERRPLMEVFPVGVRYCSVCQRVIQLTSHPPIEFLKKIFDLR